MDGYSAICKENLDSKIYKMEKLLELLNEYVSTFSVEKWTERDVDDYPNPTIICSKKYWFIKWLVDNDKIDEYKVFCDQKEYFILQVWNDNYNSENYLVDGLLMLLSISDTPIDDLISYLN